VSLPHEGEDDEDWLRDYKEFARAVPRPAQQPPQPIYVSNVKKLCSSCGFDAPVELFRDEKCLACQAADFLGPLK
jgi:hypothetical protein